MAILQTEKAPLHPPPFATSLIANQNSPFRDDNLSCTPNQKKNKGYLITYLMG